jgi:hypothetical protein
MAVALIFFIIFSFFVSLAYPASYFLTGSARDKQTGLGYNTQAGPTLGAA